jgi:hypothetical protein
MATDENFEKIIAEMEELEKGEKPAVINNEVEKEDVVELTTSDFNYPHEYILKEEGLTKDDMPEEIRKMIITFERKLRIAISDKAPEKTFLQIQNLSTLVADKIISYLESDEVSHETIVVKKEEGGGIDDGIDGGGVADEDTIIDDGEIGGVDDDLEDDEVGEVIIEEKGGMFEGVLGGIFNWNN